MSRKSTKEPSLRAWFMSRNHARYVLGKFLVNVWNWPGRDAVPHFQSGPVAELMKSIAADQPAAISRIKTDIRESFLRAFTNAVDPPKRSEHHQEEAFDLPGYANLESIYRSYKAETKNDQRPEYLSAFFSILEKVLVGTNPSDQEFCVVLNALNGENHGIFWAYRQIHTITFTARESAELLVEYLKIIAECGPVHDQCPECRAMFLRQTGERKFCHACSEKHQSYEYRKHYLLEKKREYYRLHVAQEKRALAQLKGAKPSGPKPKK